MQAQEADIGSRLAQTRGRQPKCKAYFCEERNGESFRNAFLGNGKQYFFRTTNCQEDPCHLRYISCKTAEKLLGRGELRCLNCHKRKGWTESEAEVEQVLKDKFAGFEYFPECRAVKAFCGLIDFALLDERILIQVDGAYHFRPLKKRKAVGERQADVDERCNTCAMQEGWHMLRIHVDDTQHTQALIEMVMNFAKGIRHLQGGYNWGMARSLIFSTSFRRASEGFVGPHDFSGLLTGYVFGRPEVPVSL